MSFFDDDYVKPVTKLKKGFALRDLIAGTEFEIPDPENDDEYDREDYESSSKFTPSEVESYINLSALDIEADESNNIVSFSELRKKMTSLTSDDKLLKLIKRQGTGSVVSPNSIVYIHYNGHVNLEEIPFDNSYLRRDRPERFQLGKGNLIDGLELGIRTMRKGEQAQFLMEHKYAFGKQGCPPRIPPEATVLYEVELFNFEDCAPEEMPEYLENIDRQSFEYCLKRAKEFHIRANDCFRQNNEKAACLNYNKAVYLLLGCQMKDEDEEIEQKKMLLKLYTNLSVCYIKMKRPQKVCIVARDAIYADEPKARQNAKLLYNWGSALVTLGDYKRAADILKSALRIEPNNATIKTELSKLENKKALYAEQEKIRFQKALGCQPVNRKESPKQQKPQESDSSSELIKLVTEKIEEAKSGKKVIFTPGAEVVNRIEDLCREFAPENLMVERYNSTINIYRYEKK